MKKYIVSFIVAISFIMCASPALAFSDADSANISSIELNTSQIHLDLDFGDAATDWKLFNGSTVQIPSSTGVKRAIKWGLQQVFLYLDSIDNTLLLIHTQLANINSKMDTLNTSIGNVNNAIATGNQYLRNISEKATWIWNDFTLAFQNVNTKLDTANTRLNSIIGYQLLNQNVNWLLPNNTSYTITSGADVPIINAFGFQTLFTYFNNANSFLGQMSARLNFMFRAENADAFLEHGSTTYGPYYVGLSDNRNVLLVRNDSNLNNVYFELGNTYDIHLSPMYYDPVARRYVNIGNSFIFSPKTSYYVRFGSGTPSGTVIYANLDGVLESVPMREGLDIYTNRIGSLRLRLSQPFSGSFELNYFKMDDSQNIINNQENVASGVMDNEGDDLTQTTTDFDNATTELSKNEETVFTDIDTSVGKLDFTTTSLSTYAAGFAFVNTTFLMVWDKSQPVRVLITLSCMFGILSILIGRGVKFVHTSQRSPSVPGPSNTPALPGN